MMASPTLTRSAVATVSSIFVAALAFVVAAAAFLCAGAFVAWMVSDGRPPSGSSPLTRILISFGIGGTFGAAIWAGRRWYDRMINRV